MADRQTGGRARADVDEDGVGGAEGLAGGAQATSNFCEMFMLWLHVQGDHSACSKPPVDIDLKVVF